MKIAIRGIYLLLFVGLIMAAQPAFADVSGGTVYNDICMQRIYMGSGATVSNSNLVNCTANDIRLSRVISVTPDTCIDGTTIPILTATFEVDVTANSRYDAGFFFRIDGGPNARGDGPNATGACSLSWLNIPPAMPGLDLDTDSCGDLNSGIYEATFEIPNVLCSSVEVDGQNVLKLPYCTSWHSNHGTYCNLPVSPPSPDTNVYYFKPDTKSKCVCDDDFTVPVIVEIANILVEKTASPTSVPESGGTVTYTVQITNEATYVSLTIGSIIDTLYGDLGDSSNSNVTDNNCPSKIGTTLSPGGSTSCSFKAYVEGDSGDTVTDVVEVCGTDEPGNNVCDDDDAVVSITDVYTEPTLTKTAQSAANCTVDVTYQVVVNNNSTFDSLTVNSLTDNVFGDITSVHDNVISTTCVTGGSIGPSGNYTCNFVGRSASSNCSGTLVDTVTAGVTDDDDIVSSPSDSATVQYNAPTFP